MFVFFPLFFGAEEDVVGSRVRLMGVTGPDLTAAVGLDWLLLLLGPEMPFAFVRSALILVWIQDPGIPSPNPNNNKREKYNQS